MTQTNPKVFQEIQRTLQFFGPLTQEQISEKLGELGLNVDELPAILKFLVKMGMIEKNENVDKSITYKIKT